MKSKNKKALTVVLFSCLGFIFQYLIPIILFGGVIPYTHDGIKAGLTGMGYIMLAVLAVILSGKLRKWLHERKHGVWRGLMLSIFPLVWWLLILLALGWVEGFIGSLCTYWHKLPIFIVIGRLFYTLAEAAEAKEVE